MSDGNDNSSIDQESAVIAGVADDIAVKNDFNDIGAGNEWGADSSLESLRQQLVTFADDRDWEQFHTPRNLLLAFNAEVGELCEIFQWKGEVKPGLPSFDESAKRHVGEELSDCLMCR
jgi:NTP pyrophosphatase (non-canonical NTP hydrolase)